MTKNLIFGSFDHPNMQFLHFWMILHDLAAFPNVGKHSLLSKSAISSRSEVSNSKKWPKTSFLAIWIIQNGIFMIFEWSSMCHIAAKLLRPFSTIKLCNMKSIGPSQLEKLTADWMDHSKILPLLQKKSKKCVPDFSRTCGFRGDFRESLNFHFKLSNIPNPWLDFRQNPLKVEKPLKMAVFGTVSKLLNDPDFSQKNGPCQFSTIIVL